MLKGISPLVSPDLLAALSRMGHGDELVLGAVRAGYGWAKIGRLERFAFYERVKKAFLVVQTGETRKYGNLILRKGVTPVFRP